MDKKEIIMHAIDASGFFSNNNTNAESAAVNPNIWDYKLRDYVKANLVIAPLGEQFDFTTPGVDYRVTVDDTPSVAAALTETVDVSVSAFTTRYVTFTPAEYGVRYQLSYSEAARAFFNVAERMVNKIGYQMVLKKDNLCASTVQTGAGTNYNANSVSVATNITTTDTLNLTDILKSIATMKDSFYRAQYLIVCPQQAKQLMSITTLQQANTFGTRSVIGDGVIGTLFGLQVVESHSIVVASNKAKALVLGTTGSGEKAFGIATKRQALIETFRNIQGRFVDIVGTEEYGIQVIHPSAIIAIQTYA